MELHLHGRTALITGASRGIGAAVAAELAREGCDLHLAARAQDKLDEVAALARAHGARVTTHAVDLARHEDIARLAEACGAPDILVNNAGAIPSGSLQDVDPPRWRASWDLKVFGYVDLTRILLPRMYARGSGVVICVIGAAGLHPNPNYVAGCMANAALNMFVRCMGVESFDKGVRVVAVNPGATMSDRLNYLMRESARRKLGDPERYPELMQHYPGKRVATVEEVAAAVAFLASDRAAYVSAAGLTIDAGHGQRRG
jgi:NAD(P)-dependent dehydrogenase (short-subunit alcohol dehydrogenase family)